MIAILVLLAALSIAAIAATVIVTVRDGYRARADEMWRSGLDRSASDQRTLPTRLA